MVTAFANQKGYIAFYAGQAAIAAHKEALAGGRLRQGLHPLQEHREDRFRRRALPLREHRGAAEEIGSRGVAENAESAGRPAPSLPRYQLAGHDNFFGVNTLPDCSIFRGSA